MKKIKINYIQKIMLLISIFITESLASSKDQINNNMQNALRSKDYKITTNVTYIHGKNSNDYINQSSGEKFLEKSHNNNLQFGLTYKSTPKFFLGVNLGGTKNSSYSMTELIKSKAKIGTFNLNAMYFFMPFIGIYGNLGLSKSQNDIHEFTQGLKANYNSKGKFISFGTLLYIPINKKLLTTFKLGTNYSIINSQSFYLDKNYPEKKYKTQDLDLSTRISYTTASFLDPYIEFKLAKNFTRSYSFTGTPNKIATYYTLGGRLKINEKNLLDTQIKYSKTKIGGKAIAFLCGIIKMF